MPRGDAVFLHSTNRCFTPRFEPPFERKPVCLKEKYHEEFVLTTAALGLAVSTTPAFAGAEAVNTTTVSTAGLDLSTPGGQRMLEKRVQAAAREVCGIRTISTGSRIKSQSARNCYRKALASAQTEVAAAVAGQQRGG